MDIFIAIYFIALIVEIIIRAPVDRKRRQEKMSERRITNQEQILLGLLSLGGLIAPILYYAASMGALAGRPTHRGRSLHLLARSCRPGSQLVAFAGDP